MQNKLYVKEVYVYQEPNQNEDDTLEVEIFDTQEELQIKYGNSIDYVIAYVILSNDSDKIIEDHLFSNYEDAEQRLCELEGGVLVIEDFVAIYGSDGEEIVCWTQSEWLEDPSVTISIANAIDLYHVYGEDHIKEMIGK